MMRKLFVALLVGAVAVGLAAPAFAADLKFDGIGRLRFQFDKNLDCMTEAAGTDCSGNTFDSRFRPRFSVETEGGVTAVVWFEIDRIFGAAGGGHGADAKDVETKWAYIDFPLPATPLRLRGGTQSFFAGSKGLFFDDDGSGLTLYGKLGQIDTRLWWTRLNKGAANSGSFEDQLQTTKTIGAFIGDPDEGLDVGADGEGARDVYGLDFSFSPMKDLNLNAYFVYDHDHELSATPSPLLTKGSTGFWIGVAGRGRVENIRWDLDFVYGTKETNHPAAATPAIAVDQKGYVLDGGVGMALAGTPLDLEVRGWWATGWDGTTTGDIDAFPVLYGGAGGHEPGTQVWGGGGANDLNALADNPQNTWGFGLIARYTVSPTLRLTGNVHYIGTQEEGTATQPSPAGDGWISGVDSIGTEVGVKIDYTIAKGLVFTLTAGHLFLGDDLSVDGVTRYDDATKVAGVLNYGF